MRLLQVDSFASDTSQLGWFGRIVSRFSNRWALPALELSGIKVDSGNLYAVIGKSGAGKTVFNSFLLGHPAFCLGRQVTGSGIVFLEKISVPVETFRNCSRIRRMWDRIERELSLLYLPQQLPDGRGYEMFARDYLKQVLLAQMRQLGLSKQTGRVVKRFFLSFEMHEELKPLKDKLNCAVNRLSGGERRRLELWGRICALQALPASRYALLVLDEPTSGLDMPDERRFMELLRTNIKKMDNVAAIVTTHALGLLDAGFFDGAAVVHKEISASGGVLCRVTPFADTMSLRKRFDQVKKDGGWTWFLDYQYERRGQAFQDEIVEPFFKGKV